MLSTLAGHFFQPRPRAVLDVFGLVDLTDPFYHEPKSCPDPTQPLRFLCRWPEGSLEAMFKNHDPSHAEVCCPYTSELEPIMTFGKRREVWGVEYITSEKDYKRMDLFKHFITNHEIFPLLFRKESFGTQEAYEVALKGFSGLHLLEHGKEYPPTVVMHGTADSLVPVEQATVSSKSYEN
ncbi:hypothetical protein M231_07813 [Tremella mesenterica]|uniref:Peptidase S9 prolyl oligopeptidase catalytic domain-containing protein n=1 Tax=Tremella mesenterica TaxID=5217 RepID=A0A4Q1B8H3_TREME|nr:hypothetical protein M231_07813 [Tremella mesenterica]